ncbi:MAG: AMP-binding protein [Geodermatophilaceae bacterium]|nr:AMP-binding protein [Geodermatophilaceae bacterium]MDQ3455962.1 AMP-binding protein [Actinomycetota bacterium]
MRLSPSAHVDTFCRDSLPPPELFPDLVLDLPELQYPERLNAAAVLLDDTIAAHGADRPCLRSPTETWTYAETRRTAHQIAALLVEDMGLQPGNRVLLRGPNTPWLAACWLGVVLAGGVAVTTMALLRPRELEVIGATAKVQFALCDARSREDLDAADIPGLRMLSFGGPGEDDLTSRVTTKPAEFTRVETAADDVAMIAFTSGTTGRPKGAMHFHRDILATADTFSAMVMKSGPDDVFTGTPPLAFTFGLGALLLFPLRSGGSTLLVERATPPELADLIAEHGVTTLSTAPMAYRAMITAEKAAQLSSLRCCVSAGETLPLSVWEAFHEATGIKIIDGIGSTEMLHIFIGSSGQDIRPGSTGRAVPGYTAAVLGPDGEPVPDGELGSLAVKGPTGCRYINDDRQATYVRNGWNFTGDTYRRDADGYFWYQARSDDMIISAGYNIGGPEVEAALLGHPDVAECGVVGAPDPDRGTVVSAYVVLREGAVGDEVKVKELQDFVKTQIAPYKYPRIVEFVSELPKTNTGKLQRFRLRAAAAEDVASDEAAAEDTA